MTPPQNIAPAPPQTAVQRRQPAFFSSPKNSTPQGDADDRVGIPQRKGNAQAEIADREDGQRVGNRPQTTRENRPNHQVRRLQEIGSRLRGATCYCGQGPPAEKNTHHHNQRDQNGGKSCRDELGGNLGRPQPCARRHAAEHPQALQHTHALLSSGHAGHGGSFCGGQRTHLRSMSPATSTSAGTQKCGSVATLASLLVRPAFERSLELELELELLVARSTSPRNAGYVTHFGQASTRLNH
jgi:hypothetical protein